MTIEFEEIPKIPPRHLISFSLEEHKVIQHELREILQKQVIEKVNHGPGEVISSIFTRPRRDSNKLRVILNLSHLNEFILNSIISINSLTPIVCVPALTFLMHTTQ